MPEQVAMARGPIPVGHAVHEVGASAVSSPGQFVTSHHAQLFYSAPGTSRTISGVRARSDEVMISRLVEYAKLHEDHGHVEGVGGGRNHRRQDQQDDHHVLAEGPHFLRRHRPQAGQNGYCLRGSGHHPWETHAWKPPVSRRTVSRICSCISASPGPVVAIGMACKWPGISAAPAEGESLAGCTCVVMPGSV